MKIQALVILLEGTASQNLFTLQKLAQENPNKTIKQLWQELHRN
jgi:hypothetical protein